MIGEGLDAVRPDPPYTVSQWADKNRVLSSVSSAEPGDWRTSRTPYLREIMDNLSAYSPVREQAVMKGVQIGMSEAGFNFVGYTIHHAPGPMMYVMPSLDMAKKFSKTRIDPMIEASPALSAKIRPARSRDSGNTIFSKEYDGGVFVLTGANSESGLRGLPVKALVLDEVDGYPESAEESGDPVSLAIDRTSAFSARRKIFMLSTPLLKASSRIGKAFREGDQRYYNVKCEKCGKLQPITWDKIKWEPGKPETAVFVCLETVDKKTGEISGCGHRHPNHRKKHLLAEENGAKWVPTAEAKRPNYRSYHLSALYSPWYSWEECAIRFLAAKEDPALLQTFVNNVLGEEWDDTTGETVDPDSLFAKREDFTAEPLPDGVALLTMGVDVQPDRLEAELIGWGKDEESWSVDYQVIPGDPSELEVWEQLDDYLQRRFEHPAFPDGMAIAAACIDTGGANTQDAYRFIRPREGRRIWGIKGYAGKRPVWPKKPSRNNKGRINLYAIGVDSAKEVITARLRKTGPDARGAGACHFPTDRDRDYFEQLTAERKKTRFVKGFKIVEWWKPDKARNEALDCRVYGYAALQGLIIGGINLNKRAASIAERLVELRGFQKQEPEEAPAETGGEPAPAEADAAASPEPEMTEKPRGVIKPKKRKRRGVVASPYMG
ncbi:phage terminase large subunit family protein [Brucella tritici]|uniref:Phage terminase large subunit family protein n=1 Tax=Brucella tritici TaxID=94626 RepID=A0A833CPB5_9HYPH|nr:phage terminase large subunit family protein [Brucella tritici]